MDNALVTQNNTSVHTADIPPDVFQAILTVDDNYRDHIKHFVGWCRATEHDIDITDEGAAIRSLEVTLRDYFIFLNEQSGQRANSVNVKRSAVKSRIRWIFEGASLDDQSRVDRLIKNLDRNSRTGPQKVNDISAGAQKYLSKLELEKITMAAPASISLCISFLAKTGCRVSELCGIKKGHCVRNGEYVDVLVKGKGSKERWVFIEADFYDKIADFYRGEEYLFETSGGKPLSRNYVSGGIAKLGIPGPGVPAKKCKSYKRIVDRKLGAHLLRHSFATNAVKDNLMPVDALSRYIGHADVSLTLSLYCHSSAADYKDALRDFMRDMA